MKFEHDDEATTFEPMPWGAQQRVQPRHTFRRASPALPSESIATIPPLRTLTPIFAPVATAPAPAAPFPMFVLPTLQQSAVDVTMRVRRRPFTLRSLLAVPLGAVVALVVILLVHGGGESSARAAGHVSLPTIAVETVPTIVPPPTPASAVTPVEAPAAYEPTVPVVATPAPVVAKSTKRTHRARPRKIVAVDASTPLGNLRPRHW